MLPPFLQSEVFPYSRVEIVHVDGRVEVTDARPVPAVVEVALVPTPESASGPVVDVTLVQKTEAPS